MSGSRQERPRAECRIADIPDGSFRAPSAWPDPTLSGHWRRLLWTGWPATGPRSPGPCTHTGGRPPSREPPHNSAAVRPDFMDFGHGGVRTERALSRSNGGAAMIVLGRALAAATLMVLLGAFAPAPDLPPARAVQPEEPKLRPRTIGELSLQVVAFSPDGRRIVGGTSDNKLVIWDATTGKAVGEPLSGHPGLTALAFSPDGRRLVASEGGALVILDATTGRPLGAPFGEGAASIAFSPDGARIVSGSNNSVRIWDAATGKSVGAPLTGHTDDVTSVAFSPDGRRIASGSWDKTVRIWNADTGQPVGAPLEGHSDIVNVVAFSPDGRRIVSGSDDATLRIWDAATGKLVGAPIRNRYPYRNDPERTVLSGVRSVAFSPDGRRIASGSQDETIRIWDAATGQQVGLPLAGHEWWVDRVAFSPDGLNLLSASYEHGLRVWDVAASTLRRPNGLPEGVEWGRCLLVVHGKTLISGKCAYSVEEGGGLSIEGPRQIYPGIDYPISDCGCGQRSNDYWASIFKDERGWAGYGNSDIHYTHGDQDYEVLQKKGACFVNADVQVCLWK